MGFECYGMAVISSFKFQVSNVVRQMFLLIAQSSELVFTEGKTILFIL